MYFFYPSYKEITYLVKSTFLGIHPPNENLQMVFESIIKRLTSLTDEEDFEMGGNNY